MAGTQAASALINLNYHCEGVVISDDGYCHLFSDPRHIEHDGTDSTLVQGRRLYAHPSPPPPPLEPAGVVCLAYSQVFDEVLEPAGVLAGASQVTAASGLTPWECCSRCDQEPTCMGFTVVRATGVCNFYGTRYATNTNNGQFGITAYAKHTPVARTTVKPMHVGSWSQREQHSHGVRPDAAVICEEPTSTPEGSRTSSKTWL